MARVQSYGVDIMLIYAVYSFQDEWTKGWQDLNKGHTNPRMASIETNHFRLALGGSASDHHQWRASIHPSTSNLTFAPGPLQENWLRRGYDSVADDFAFPFFLGGGCYAQKSWSIIIVFIKVAIKLKVSPIFRHRTEKWWEWYHAKLVLINGKANGLQYPYFRNSSYDSYDFFTLNMIWAGVIYTWLLHDTTWNQGFLGISYDQKGLPAQPSVAL